MHYKCPYCLFAFTDAQVQSTTREGMAEYFCPNPATVNDTERPLCGKRLPLNFLESTSIVLALTGGQYVGKTYYYLALLYQLKFNRVLHQLGIQGDIVGSDSDKAKLDHFFHLVRQGIRLDATSDIKDALRSIMHLTITKGSKQKHVYLSFFDNPGEKFSDIEHMRDNFANVYKADGVMFLVEPKQVEKFWKSLLKKRYIKEEIQTPDDFYTVLNNVVQLIKHVQNHPVDEATRTIRSPSLFGNRWGDAVSAAGLLRSRGKITTPLAICISKFDQLEKGIHLTIPFDEKELDSICMRNEKFNEEIINTISSELAEVLTGPPDGEARIKNLLEANLDEYAFFGLKSIDVDSDGVPVELNPQGVLLPLIWLLIRLKLY